MLNHEEEKVYEVYNENDNELYWNLLTVTVLAVLALPIIIGLFALK